MTNKQIANRAGISDKTIKSHLCHIFRKLGVHRRSQLVAYRLAHPDRGADQRQRTPGKRLPNNASH